MFRAIQILILLTIVVGAAAHAHSGGITGYSDKTANRTCVSAQCHANNNYSTKVNLYKTATTIVPDTAIAGRVYDFTLLVSGSGPAAGEYTLEYRYSQSTRSVIRDRQY